MKWNIRKITGHLIILFMILGTITVMIHSVTNAQTVNQNQLEIVLETPYYRIERFKDPKFVYWCYIATTASTYANGRVLKSLSCVR